jgi:hypothetical protein
MFSHVLQVHFNVRDVLCPFCDHPYKHANDFNTHLTKRGKNRSDRCLVLFQRLFSLEQVVEFFESNGAGFKPGDKNLPQWLLDMANSRN